MFVSFPSVTRKIVGAVGPVVLAVGLALVLLLGRPTPSARESVAQLDRAWVACQVNSPPVQSKRTIYPNVSNALNRESACETRALRHWLATGNTLPMRYRIGYDGQTRPLPPNVTAVANAHLEVGLSEPG
jgi:hypothetical protein